jgi:hypothetical protein
MPLQVKAQAEVKVEDEMAAHLFTSSSIFVCQLVYEL